MLHTINNYLIGSSFFFCIPQKIVEGYYGDGSTYESFLSKLIEKKSYFVGDAVCVLLICKMLRRNITIVTPHKMWTMYTHLKPDIVLAYKGYNKWCATNTYGDPKASGSK